MTNNKSLHTSSFTPPLEGQGEASLLIANRGEIAVRVIRAAQKMGIRSVAVYAADDADSLHVALADEAFLLSGDTLEKTYLNQQKIIQIALDSGVGAIHPGYGFLSENAGFAKKVSQSGLVFIGPSPENILLMGEKNRALTYVVSLGIPILKSFRGTSSEILQHASEMDFPVMVKASGGGGGKGMLVCHSSDELLPALQRAERQAISYFGNGELFVEKYLPRARHIEVQLIADHHGKVLHFYERECSMQRRFQKIIEESPSPSIDENLREKLTSDAIKIARSMNYRNAGTIEFLLDENGQYYFLEMNTRIQVEHPVTEMITNTDLVALQLMVAAGNHLPMIQEDIRISGHAIEVRICAEDASKNFLPSAGKLVNWEIPKTQSLRVETFVSKGITISANYDSLLAKIVVHGENRSQAINQIKQGLAEMTISGIHTNLSFLAGLVESKAFQENDIYTAYIDNNLEMINQQIQDKRENLNKYHLVIAYLIFHFQEKKHSGNSVWNQIGFWRIFPQFKVLVEGQTFDCQIVQNENEPLFRINRQDFLVSEIKLQKNTIDFRLNQQTISFHCMKDGKQTWVGSQSFLFELKSYSLLDEVSLDRKNQPSTKIFQNLICADLFGKVLKLNVQTGDNVRQGQILLTLESMKTEINVLCPMDAQVKKIHIKEGNNVIEKQLMVELQPPPTPPKGERPAH